MLKKKLILIVSIAMISMCGTYTVNADGWDGSELPVYVNGSHAEVAGYYDGYVLHDDSIFESHTDSYGWWPCESTKDGLTIKFDGGYYDFTNATIRIPDKINKYIVTRIKGSCGFKKFDLNPENRYMECIDNVLFSKDKKTLLSYAKFDERSEYVIPDGTECIERGALAFCDNLMQISLPNSITVIEDTAMGGNSSLKTVYLSKNVKTIPDHCFFSSKELKTVNIPKNSKLNLIEESAFDSCESLNNLYLPSFEIEIDRSAFGYNYKKTHKTHLKSYVQPKVSVSENKLSWEKIPNASYYEIYQKLNSGEYKLLKTTKATACKFTTLKSGKKYTFAVKPVAVIPAANYDKEKDEGSYPETFTIEGTMSEDIVVIGK